MKTRNAVGVLAYVAFCGVTLYSLFVPPEGWHIKVMKLVSGIVCFTVPWVFYEMYSTIQEMSERLKRVEIQFKNRDR